MPLRPLLLDLREHPLCERSMRFLLSLEKLAPGDTLLVVNDRDPKPLLEELKPVLEKGFDYWVPETGPKTWHILVSCEEHIEDDDHGEVAESAIGTDEEDSLRRYIREVRSVWGDGKDPELPARIKALLEKLLVSTSPQEPWIARLIHKGLPSSVLYRDAEHGFIQMGHVHGKGHKNPPHDHGPCWAVCGVYHGVTEVTIYRRTDSGEIPGLANLEKKELQRLKPGVAMYYHPGAILSSTAVEHSVVFRFLSSDPNRVERFHYLWDGRAFRPVAIRGTDRKVVS